jgi:hypothetical protein
LHHPPKEQLILSIRYHRESPQSMQFAQPVLAQLLLCAISSNPPSELERQLASVKQTLDDSQSNGQLAARSGHSDASSAIQVRSTFVNEIAI